ALQLGRALYRDNPRLLGKEPSERERKALLKVQALNPIPFCLPRQRVLRPESLRIPSVFFVRGSGRQLNGSVQRDGRMALTKRGQNGRLYLGRGIYAMFAGFL